MNYIGEVRIVKGYNAKSKNNFGVDQYGGKFILAWVNGKRVLWASDAHYLTEHADLVESLGEVSSAAVDCIGGGRLYIDDERATIYVWDSSVRYGRAHQPTVHEMLMRTYPDYTINPDDPSRYSPEAIEREKEDYRRLFGKEPE